MPTFGYMPFPSPLLGARTLRLENDFVDGPIATTFAPDGTLHVMCELDYNAAKFKEPPSDDLYGHYLTRFDASLGSPRMTMLAPLTAALGEGPYDALVDLAVVSEGWLVMSRAGRSWLVGEDGKIVRAFAVDDWDNKPKMYRENFAVRGAMRPDGRIVVGVAEADTNMAANVIAISLEPPVFAKGQPLLRYLTSLAKIADVGAEIPYVRLADGKPFVDKARPGKVLSEIKGNPGYGAWLGGLCAVSDRTTLVAVYSRYTTFQLALVDDTGAFVAELDLDGDTPYKDDHLVVAADQRHGRVVFKSKAHLHVFDERGNTIKRIDLTDNAFKPLAAFHLLGVSPTGQILLCHKKQHTLLLVDPTPEIKELRPALAAAAAHYKVAWAAAKKVHKPVNGRWIMASEAGLG